MLIFFPPDVLNEILDLIESVFEGFPSYSSNSCLNLIWRMGRPFRGDDYFFLLCLPSHWISGGGGGGGGGVNYFKQ